MADTCAVDTASSVIAVVRAMLYGTVKSGSTNFAFAFSGKTLAEARAPVRARLDRTSLALPTLTAVAGGVVAVAVTRAVGNTGLDGAVKGGPAGIALALKLLAHTVAGATRRALPHAAVVTTEARQTLADAVDAMAVIVALVRAGL